VLVSAKLLTDFVTRVFSRLSVPPAEARIAARSLVAADLMGIDTHGIMRLEMYAAGLRSSAITPSLSLKEVKASAVSSLLDAGHGLGLVAAARAMELAIVKARARGVGMVTVRRSSHFGAAGVFSKMALSKGMIGIAMTNTPPIMPPLGGREKLLGNNPFSIAVPAKKEPPFLLDFATGTVSLGKIEEAWRARQKMPYGWALDSKGRPTTRPDRVLDLSTGIMDVVGALLPLGSGSNMAGHKGYALTMMIEILSGALSDGTFGPLYREKTGGVPGIPNDVGHFFSAIRVDLFRPLGEFQKTMDHYLHSLRTSAKVPGVDRIYTPGEKEFLTFQERSARGIPLREDALRILRKVSEQTGVKLGF
jgi:LDH2 family malate/lactate/ureidoglycolate dehydrogenase